MRCLRENENHYDTSLCSGKGRNKMKERIRKHIDGLFKDAPKTRKAMELKEEMIQNTLEKYQDLIGEGYQEEDAYQNVVNSIGDVTELFGELEEKNLLNLPEDLRRRRAMLKTIAVGLYIFAGAMFITGMVVVDFYFYMMQEAGMLVFVATICLCIPPTCMLVYAANMYPAFSKKEENLVETYKEAVHARNKRKAVKVSVGVTIWIVTITIYFIISFATCKWDVTWITFLIGACAQAISELVFNLRRSD